MDWRDVDRPLTARLLRAARKHVWYRSEKRVYVYPVQEVQRLPRRAAMRRDWLNDLDFYEQTSVSQPPFVACLEAARNRLARGEHLYTRVENGVLLHYAWLIPSQACAEDVAIGQVFYPPPGSAALYDHFTHPAGRRRGLFFDAMCQMLQEVPILSSAKQAYIYVYADNERSRRVIEKIGFRYAGSMVQDRRFGLARRYALPAAAEFDSALL
jgi:hypothetical protein